MAKAKHLRVYDTPAHVDSTKVCRMRTRSREGQSLRHSKLTTIKSIWLLIFSLAALIAKPGVAYDRGKN